MKAQDIVFPKDNEQEFIDIGKKLGTSSFIFCYDKETIIGCIVEKQQDVRRAKSWGLFSLSLKNTRDIIEAGPDMVAEVERFAHKDSVHHRNSGLNHVLARIMKEKETQLGFSLSLLLNATTEERWRFLGRMKQNMKIAGKAGVTVGFFSFARSPSELRGKKGLDHLLNNMGRIFKSA